MSVHEGKKVVAAKVAFHQAIGDAPWEKLAITLQQRELGEKHFAEAYKFTSGFHLASHIKIIDTVKYNPNSKLDSRALFSTLLEMAVAKDKNGNVSYDNYVPSLYKIALTKNALVAIARTFPLYFSSQHTEYRFIQRTGEALNYANKDVQWAMITGLFMALTLPKILDQSPNATAPFALPHASGFYLGYATRCPANNYYPRALIVSMNKGPNGTPALHGLMKENGEYVHHGTKVEWSPESDLTIQTFIGTREFFPIQQRLHNVFTEIFQNPRMNGAYKAMQETYERGYSINSEEIQWAAERFEEIYKLPEWASVIEFGKKHLPSFNPG